MWNNGTYNGQAAGPSQHHSQQPANIAQYTFTHSDALRARQIMLEQAQKKLEQQHQKIDHQKSLLNAALIQEEARERQEAQRLQAEALALQAQIAAADEAKQRLAAINRKLGQGVPALPMLTYEPTPSTTQIVPVEEDQGGRSDPNVGVLTHQNAAYPTNPNPYPHQPQQQYQHQHLHQHQHQQQQQQQQQLEQQQQRQQQRHQKLLLEQYRAAQLHAQVAQQQNQQFQQSSVSVPQAQNFPSQSQQRQQLHIPQQAVQQRTANSQPSQSSHGSHLSGQLQQQSVQRPNFPLPSNLPTSQSFSSLTTGFPRLQAQANQQQSQSPANQQGSVAQPTVTVHHVPAPQPGPISSPWSSSFPTIQTASSTQNQPHSAQTTDPNSYRTNPSIVINSTINQQQRPHSSAQATTSIAQTNVANASSVARIPNAPSAAQTNVASVTPARTSSPSTVQTNVASTLRTTNVVSTNAPTTVADSSSNAAPQHSIKGDRERLLALQRWVDRWAKQAQVGQLEGIPGTLLVLRGEVNDGYTIGRVGKDGFIPLSRADVVAPLRHLIVPQGSTSVASTPAVPSTTTTATTTPFVPFVAEATSQTSNITPQTPITMPTIPQTMTASALHTTNSLGHLVLRGPEHQLPNVSHNNMTAPSTPMNKGTDVRMGNSPRTPAEANKKSLARDLLRALGTPREKRPRESFGESDARATKRQVLADISVAQVPINSSVTVAQVPINASVTVAQAPINASVTMEAPNNASVAMAQALSVPAVQLPAVNHQISKPLSSSVTPQVVTRTTERSSVSNNLPDITTASAESSVSQSAVQSLPAPSLYLPAAPTSPVRHSTTSQPITMAVGALPSVSSAPKPSSPLKALSPKEIPLFLPTSSSPSPPPAIEMDVDVYPAESDTVRDSDGEVIDDPRSRGKNKNKKARAGKKMIMDYVEIPPAPGWVKRDRLRRLSKLNARENREEIIEILDSDEEKRVRQLPENAAKVSRRGYSSRTAIGEETHSSRPTPTTVRDPLELVVLKLAVTRLQSSSCKWGGCEIVLNSAEKLAQHLRAHVAESQQAMGRHRDTMICKICGRHEAQVLGHVENHAFHTLYCPYQGCGESFRSLHQLSQHTSKGHRDDDTLRPSADLCLFPPTLQSPPDTPLTLPSYMVVARAVTPHPISKDRHQLLGPWVLKNMMPPVDTLDLKRYLKAKHLGRVEIPNASDEYDFLVTRSSHSCMPSRPAKIRDLGDLNSIQLSQLITDGMTLSLWGKESAPKAASESAVQRFPSLSAPPAGGSNNGEGPSGRSTDEPLLTKEDEVIDVCGI